MGEVKTKQTGMSVDAFIEGVDPKRQEDCRIMLELMREITGKNRRCGAPA